MNVIFLNENTLGHASYLPRFVGEFERRPELGICPFRLDATPLPAALQRRADFTIRGLRRFGLDLHITRWRRVVSEHARQQVEDFRRRTRVDAVVVNTQSAGLGLAELAREIPVLVCLDATFTQLRRSRWFAMNRVAGWLTPLTLASLVASERRLLAASSLLLPWSPSARASLLSDYRLSPGIIELLPPSLDIDRLRPRDRVPNAKPQILFVGGHFARKGGPRLLEAFRQSLAARCELHLVTETPVPAEAGVFVHHKVAPGSDAWFERWQRADVFVFPSTLETFGIVLLEALAFNVPVIASRAGAAVHILDHGRNGVLLDRLDAREIASAVDRVLADSRESRERALVGRRKIEREYALVHNTERLAQFISRAALRREGPHCLPKA